MRSFLAALVAAMLVSCGGEPADVTESPTAFLGVAAASVPLASAPRVAASPDGNTTWLAWAEGDNARQALVAARVNSIGIIEPMTVVPMAAGVIRDLQISMIGVTPVLTWRHFRDPNDVTVNAASFRGLDWQTEIAALASAQGTDVKPVTLPSGRMSLAWTRLGGAGNFELVAARRRLDGSWSTPAVIRTGSAGMVVLRSAQASDSASGLMAIWSEAPGTGAAPAETLLSSQFDETLDAWGAAITVDAGQHYGEAAIASPADAQWVTAWLSGGALGNTALWSKRFSAGAWSPATTRVDVGQDAALAELVLTSRNHHVHLAWIGLPNGAATGSVRDAAFDASAGAWSAPSLIGATPRGLPAGLRMRVEFGGTAAAVWGVSQGDGGPFLNKTDAAGAWPATAMQLDPVTAGAGPDVELFSASDIATTWYRVVAGGGADVVVRRIR